MKIHGSPFRTGTNNLLLFNHYSTVKWKKEKNTVLLVLVGLACWFLGVLDTISYHDNKSKQGCAGGHHEEGVDEPCAPEHTVSDTHGLQSLFQPHLLLQHDALHCHRDRIDPGQHHEDRKAAIQSEHEAVAWVVNEEKKTDHWYEHWKKNMDATIFKFCQIPIWSRYIMHPYL